MLTNPQTIAGRVRYPGDGGWDDTRGTFNLILDQRPAAIALPRNEREVVDATRLARCRGGGGSFGIVTAIEFWVHPVGGLYAGAMSFPYERAGEVLPTWRARLPTLPDELTSWASILRIPDVPFVPEPLRGGSFGVILAPPGPVVDTAPPAVPAELAMDPPDALPYETADDDLLGTLPGGAIDELIEAAGPQSGIVALHLRHLGGALSRPPAGAGARGDAAR